MSYNKPKVSVVIPTYNRAHMLSKSLNSVLNQTYQNFEVIIVDDGSSDNTEEVIRSFQKVDKRIVYIKHEKNKGQSAAENSGIKLAEGEYIAFQDSDDEWLPEKLEKQIRLIEKSDSDLGVVYTGFLRIMGNKKVYVPGPWVKQKDGYIYNELLKGNFVGTPTILARKECFQRLGLFDERLKALQDWDLVLRFSKFYKFAFIDEPLVLAPFIPDSLSVNYKVMLESYELIISKYYDDFYKDKFIASIHNLSLSSLHFKCRNFKMGIRYLMKAFKEDLKYMEYHLRKAFLYKLTIKFQRDLQNDSSYNSIFL